MGLSGFYTVQIFYSFKAQVQEFSEQERESGESGACRLNPLIATALMELTAISCMYFIA